MTAPNFQIFLDMDDTLVATSPFIQDYFNYPAFWIHTDYKTKTWRDRCKDVLLWIHLAHNCHLLKTLPPKENYQDLYTCAKLLDPTPKILTALPDIFTKQAHVAKRWWLGQHMSEIQPHDIFVTRSRHKHRYIKKDNGSVYILIDDNPRVCARWTNAGGISIQIRAENHNSAIEEVNEKLHVLMEWKNSGMSKEEIVKKWNTA